MVNDSWSEAGNNCIIKWNAKRRRVEVWTVVDVPLYKELGAAYNDPYWYWPNNGIRTHEQAVQIRNYYNKTDLPPYGEDEVERNTQMVPLIPESPQAVGPTAPNLSVITIDVDMENDMEAANRPDKAGTELSWTDQWSSACRWRVSTRGTARRRGTGCSQSDREELCTETLLRQSRIL